MRRTLTLLAFAIACLIPATMDQVQAQGVIDVQDFKAYPHPLRSAVLITWWAAEDTEILSFGLEHSLDDMNYTELTNIPALYTGEQGHNYSYWHLDPELGPNYYRLVVYTSHDISKVVAKSRVNLTDIPIWSFPSFPRAGGTGLIGPLQDDNDDNWIEARISDLYGRPIMSIREGSRADIPELPSGMYVLSARYASSGWQSTTFVVTND